MILDKININTWNLLFLRERLQRVISCDVVQCHQSSSPTECCTKFVPLACLGKGQTFWSVFYDGPISDRVFWAYVSMTAFTHRAYGFKSEGPVRELRLQTESEIIGCQKESIELFLKPRGSKQSQVECPEVTIQ